MQKTNRRNFIKNAALAGAVGIAAAPTALKADGMTNWMSVVVESVDELTSDLKSASDTVIVKDMLRGGIFIYDATKADIKDGGVIFNGWVRQFEGPLNVHWFGAKGDGIHDDTWAIQQPIDLIRNGHYPFNKERYKTSTVYLPTGRYRVTDSIRLKQIVSLEGEPSYSERGAEIFCDFTDFTPPGNIYNNMNGDHYRVTLDKKPILYNH
jgi:polygalacturonase